MKFKFHVAAVATVIMAMSTTSALALTDTATEEGNVCAEIAQQLADQADATTNRTASFACLGNQVVVTTDEGERVSADIAYADTVPSSERQRSSEVIEVPFTSTQAAQNFCAMGGYDREIRSERQALMWGCVVYGEYNQSTGQPIWTRNIQWEWNMYPGWSSAQNTLRTIPSAGAPVMSGVFESYRQNGIFPPAPLDASIFTNRGNTTTSGWNVGSLTRNGQYSVWMLDVQIVDTARGFNEYFGGSVASHRFTCQESSKRCFFPNGQEAPL